MKIQLTEILTKNMFIASVQVNCCELHEDNELINFEKRRIMFNIKERKSLCWFLSALI